MKYLYLFGAIVFEVIGTLCLKPNQNLNPVVQAGIVIVGYGISFWFLYLVLDKIPIGIVYATWSGVGITLVAVLGIYFFEQKLDLAAWIGIALIIGGVLTMNLLSKSSLH